MTPGDKEQASLRYINPAAQWTQYKKVLLEPVTFWADEDKTSLSAADQQMLCNFLHEQLYDTAQDEVRDGERARTGGDAASGRDRGRESATPVLRTISMAIPRRGC